MRSSSPLTPQQAKWLYVLAMGCAGMGLAGAVVYVPGLIVGNVGLLVYFTVWAAIWHNDHRSGS